MRKCILAIGLLLSLNTYATVSFNASDCNSQSSQSLGGCYVNQTGMYLHEKDVYLIERISFLDGLVDTHIISLQDLKSDNAINVSESAGGFKSKNIDHIYYSLHRNGYELPGCNFIVTTYEVAQVNYIRASGNKIYCD